MTNTRFDNIIAELRAIRALLERPAPHPGVVDAGSATTFGELADTGVTLGELADAGLTLGELASSGLRRARR